MDQENVVDRMHLDFDKVFDLGSHELFVDQVKKYRPRVRLQSLQETADM